MILWLNDARGMYLPRDFANSFADRAKTVAGVSDDDWAILEAGPDHELYWDVWSDVCDHALITDDKGVQYRINQDGDCWLVPVGMEWDDKADTYVWPKEQADD